MTERALLTSPVNTISPKLSSHRSAEAHIYEDIIDYKGYNVTVDYGKETNYEKYDRIFVYHGNEFSGGLNLFGGIENEGLAKRFTELSKIDPSKVVSLSIGFPNYSELLQKRLEKKPSDLWEDVDWKNLERMIYSKVQTMFVPQWDKFIIGDSHAICMYRRGWNVKSIPFKTLYGAIKIGFDTLLEMNFPKTKVVKEAEFYFGNIDIRHHLARQDDPYSGAFGLAERYAEEVIRFSEKYNCKVSIYEPLPIESEERRIPKTGWYKGTPFYGDWNTREAIRDVFIGALIEYEEVNLVRWTEKLLNEKGELDFKCMEKPQSVHLSREYYPWWQGRKQQKEPTLESFM